MRILASSFIHGEWVQGFVKTDKRREKGEWNKGEKKTIWKGERRKKRAHALKKSGKKEAKDIKQEKSGVFL